MQYLIVYGIPKKFVQAIKNVLAGLLFDALN